MPRILLLCCFTAAVLSAATVDGIPLHYETAGNGARTIMLIHGWTCDSTSWSEQVPTLAKRYRVITVDLPGHGKSGRVAEEKLSMELFARAVEAVRAEVGASQVILAGHSMGTAVIIEYTKRYPERTAAMVFVDGLMTWGPTRRTFDPKTLLGDTGRKRREDMVNGMIPQQDPDPLRQKIVDMMMAAPEATAVGAMRAMFEPALWQDAHLETPILGLYAEKTSLLNKDFVAAHYPKARMEQIPGTGHFLMLEKPEEFNQRMLAFLDAVSVQQPVR